jgi:hypothetical protein
MIHSLKVTNYFMIVSTETGSFLINIKEIVSLNPRVKDDTKFFFAPTL